MKRLYNHKININYNMKKIIVCVFIFVFICFIALGIKFVNGYFSDRIEVYINNKGTLYTQSYLEEAIRESVVNNLDIDSMYYISKKDEEVNQVLISTSKINQILSEVNKTLNINLKRLNNETISIPIGIVFGDAIFSQVGPNINLKIMPVGSFTCDVMSDVKEYGINNSLFEIYIKVALKIETLIPLRNSEADVICKIPLVIQILQGNVPRYYYNTDSIIPDVYDNN